MTALMADETRVVIVDDTPDMRMLLRVVIDRYGGLEVVGEADNGLAAVEQATRHQPDVMLLDLAMPTMDGMEALPLIKRAAPACNVIVLSAFESDRMADSAIAAGATLYLQKGATPQQLVGAIADTAGRPMPDLKVPPARVMAQIPSPSSDTAPPPPAAPEPDRALARAAHELRNPAIALTMLADQLSASMAAAEDPTVAAMLNAVVRQAAILDRITTDLLTSAQAKRGSLTVRPVALDVMTALEVAAEASGAPVTIACPPDLAVLADRDRLQQMVTNLLSNAGKYGAPPVRMQVTAGADTIEIRVIDHGPGVPEWFRADLFSEYSRAEPDRGSGTGIGLYIVASLAEAHGGSIRHEARRPGSAFCLTLPRATLDRPAQSRRTPAP